MLKIDWLLNWWRIFRLVIGEFEGCVNGLDVIYVNNDYCLLCNLIYVICDIVYVLILVFLKV